VRKTLKNTYERGFCRKREKERERERERERPD
jgi:hypothetical protein